MPFKLKFYYVQNGVATLSSVLIQTLGKDVFWLWVIIYVSMTRELICKVNVWHCYYAKIKSSCMYIVDED